MPRKILFILLVAGLLSSAVSGEDRLFQENAYGKLTIYSDVPGSDIFVDTKFVGQDRAMISNIPVGKHYVRVVKDETTIKSGLVEVRENEETIIVAKPAEEELLSRYKRQNRIHIYASYASLSYEVKTPGNVTIPASIGPLYGVNFEGIFPFAGMDINAGFRFNMAATVSTPEGKVTEANISGPYLNISKNIINRFLGNRNLDLNIGGGLNYSFYSGQMISITGTYGYQLYAEILMKGELQNYLFRGGYMVYNGRGSNQNNYTNSGFFITGGFVYKL